MTRINPLPENIQSIIQQIRTYASFHIVSHENPDGDSMGAQLAMVLGLRSLRKRAYIHAKDPVPKIYEFLQGQEWLIISEAVKMEAKEALIALDCGHLERTGLSFIPGPPPMIINIDHHISNNHFGHFDWVDTRASGTSEMVYLLLKELDVELTPAIATNLYTGILTDTGSFQYSNTTAQCLRIAGELVHAQADPKAIASAVYNRKALPAIRLMGHVLNEMEIHFDQSVAILTVTRKILKDLQATYEDTEELVNIPQKVGSIKVSILIKEIDEDAYKVSFRSKGYIDVAQLAAGLEGGGHPNAAGAKMTGKLPQVKDRILKLVEALLPSRDS